MTGVLSEAVQRLNLQPGQTAREVVNGHTAELRLIAEVPPTDLEISVMLDWPMIPDPPGGRVVTARLGPPQYPKPAHIDDSDLAPE